MADKMLIDGLIKFCDAKSKNIKLKAEPQVFIEIKQALEELKTLKDIDEDLRLKYCYEDLSNAEHRGYCQGSNEAVDDFAKFLHDKAKKNNGLRLSSETRSWTHPSIFDYLEEFKNEQICKEEVDCESEE